MCKKDWQAPKGKDCKLKCRIRLEKEPLLNDDRVIQDFLTRKFLRFNICIMKEPNKAEGKSQGSKASLTRLGDEFSRDDARQHLQVSKFSTNYMIDVQLVKGTPVVFLDFVQNFFSAIETRLNMQHHNPRTSSL